MKTEYTQAWLDGFVKAAADQGLTDEETRELVKVATRTQLATNPEYQAAFDETMSKEAGGWKSILGLLGVGGAGGAFMQHLRGTPRDRRVSQAIRRARGAGDADEVLAAMRNEMAGLRQQDQHRMRTAWGDEFLPGSRRTSRRRPNLYQPAPYGYAQ